MAQDSLQCLAQLASLHGPVFPDEGAQVDYLAHFIEGLLSTINGQVYLPFVTKKGTFRFSMCLTVVDQQLVIFFLFVCFELYGNLTLIQRHAFKNEQVKIFACLEMSYCNLYSITSNICYLVCRIEIEDSEAVGISSIISNLITVFPRNVLTAIPSELFSSFVNCLTHLTCSFGRSAALEEVVSDHSELLVSLVHKEIYCAFSHDK